MGGVTVSAKADGATITTTVFTDETGNYYFPPLPAGKYRVWAQALGFEAAKTEIDLSAAKPRQLTDELAAGAALLTLLASNTVAHGFAPQWVFLASILAAEPLRPIVAAAVAGIHIYTTTTGAMKNAFGGLLNTRRHYTHSWIHETLVDLLAI